MPPEPNPIDVVYVEDDPQLRLMYRVNLVADGFHVREAGNGEEALVLIDQAMPDVLLADILMPRMDGVELARRLHEQCGAARPPVVFLSANPAEVEEGVLRVVADEYLRKPFPPASLAVRLREVVRRRREADAAAS